MKKIYSIFILSAVLLSACQKNSNNGNGGSASSAYGTLVISQLQNDASEIKYTKAKTPADGNYVVSIYDGNDGLVYKSTYAQIRENDGRITLLGGDYRFVASSIDGDVPVAEFESPVYGAETTFTITPNVDTKLGEVICTLVQTKVTVEYNDEFLKCVTGDGVATVEVINGYPLTYDLVYNQLEAPRYDKSAGYFALNKGQQNSMLVTFKGSVDGKTGKMTKMFANVKAQEWHQVVFVKQVDPEGNASFQVNIDGFIEDVELTNDIPGEEQSLGDDPNIPSGDGGIELVSTCSYDISQPITVPELPTPFVLTLKANVPEKVKKFQVEIDSDNPDFVNSVFTMTGSTTLDLVNPSAGATVVFTELLPFPYGEQVKGKTEIDFDLSGAQTPILAFKGHHVFVMKVADENGHKKDIQVELVVE